MAELGYSWYELVVNEQMRLGYTKAQAYFIADCLFDFWYLGDSRFKANYGALNFNC